MNINNLFNNNLNVHHYFDQIPIQVYEKCDQILNAWIIFKFKL